MIIKTMIVPRHPPPNFAAPAPAIIDLKKAFMILILVLCFASLCLEDEGSIELLPLKGGAPFKKMCYTIL